ncbi:DNA primase catalytic subunit PriS [Candidatus Micrarchaeota archaeon]|nr:DNA primase catalytic subunit PriS [Candidatus Micrarchaeota archaeon]
MDQNERKFASEVFSEYYKGAKIEIPKIEQREFGFGNIKKIDARHLSFGTREEFRKYLVNNTPLFVSHSASYYEFPSGTPMVRKGFLGADLVFDLDIHAEGKYGAYEKLEAVKSDAVRLLKDFIMGDFGVKKENLIVVFSGNRGYHIHIRDERFRSLMGEERRELVDYVMGNGLNYREFFSLSDTKPQRLLGPTPSEGGYRGRFAKETIRAVREKPSTISKTLKEDKLEFFIKGIEEGNWSRTSIAYEDVIKRLGAIAQTLPVSSVDTDAGVTQDLSKLIRVPNSIHGETGFIARVIDIANLENFDPFNDALVNDKKSIKIEFLEDVPELRFRKETVGKFKKGDIAEFETPISMFYLLKSSAKMR